ncbi:tetratricopeptide repeat protein [Streptomyces sp. GMY02]|uniref:AfsR/SARP family transcriptional regulator n=1 Tax=Streptomyces sp. GMY02 TaxID=1333528 RepID=UPI001C2B80D8|nr:BTAD domain-containing putative transcriptional regulator [Streptomyces sp. GMY02]QXE34557.1 tetratricopeptide repeat protein [Streptomyces sp. GMY02]
MRFAILGPVRAWRREEEVTLGPPQQRVLLAVLLAHAGRPVSMDTMVDALWGEEPPASAANAVYRQMGELRRRLEPGLPPRATGRWLVRESGGYRLNADVDTLDLLSFRDLIGRARAANRSGDLDKSVALFLEAVDLRQGPTAAGIPAESRAHPVFTALDREYLIAVKEATDTALDHGAAERLLMVLHRVAAEHPLDEPLQARLVLVLAAAGHRAEALDTWQKVRAELAAELGISPGPELREAQTRVLRTDSPATGDGADRRTGPAARGSAYTAPTPDTDPVRPASPLIPPLAQLPADLPVFAGRRADLTRARFLLSGRETMTPATVILAISGMGGVGKSTLAVHLSHQMAHRYPDGQLYVNLRGFDPSATAMDPREAVRGFLTALGLSPQHIPADADGEAGAYRSLLAGRRVLILLDNARDAAQIRPLLPGTPNCLVIVTSRNRLLGLGASHGAQILELDPFPTAEARELLVRRIGAPRVIAESHAAAEIVRHCAGLPLALAVVATRAAAHPDFPLAAIAAELSEAQGSLDAFTDPEPAGDVRTVFSWSYRTLSPDAARLLRLLALHPGPDTGAPAASALIGVPMARTRQLLAELTRAHLLSEHAPGRYICHDLVRLYAMELTERHDPRPRREAAVRRLLDHYLYTAHAAGRLYSPWWTATTLPPALEGATPETLDDDGQALRWYTAERHVLREVVDLAVRTGSDTHAWQLAWCLERFWDRQGHWHDSEAMQRVALAAATRAGHRAARAHLLRGLARASARLKRYDEAHTHIAGSLELHTALGDRLGLAHAHRSQGWLFDQTERYDDSQAAVRKALALYEAVGDRVAQTSCHHALGWTHVLRGEHRLAVPYFERALTELAGLSNRYGEAGTWDSLGHAHHRLGDHRRATTCYQHALRLYRQIGDRYNEAGTLHQLGDAYHAVGDYGSARTVWQHSLAIFAPMDHQAADEIRTKLKALGDAVPAPRISLVAEGRGDDSGSRRP